MAAAPVEQLWDRSRTPGPTMPILHSTLAESRDYSSHLMSSKGAIINLFFLKKEKKDLKKSLYHVMSA